jgi:hypothetical protein
MLLQKWIFDQLVKKIFAFMEPENSLPWSTGMGFRRGANNPTL